MILVLMACSSDESATLNSNIATQSALSSLDFTKSFEGTINGEYGITMILTRIGNSLNGTYSYTSKRIPIKISGNIDSIGNLTINEFNAAGSLTGIFKGQLNGLNITGNWEKPDGSKTMPFSISETTNENQNLSDEQKSNPNDFLPNGYVLFEKIEGDLNRDGLNDCVLIIKGTDKSKIIQDEYRGKLDLNRRGILVLFRKNSVYELTVKNYNCFSSENEDGGVYYAPELTIQVEKGDLYVQYAHGRYGYWNYTMRYQNLDFEMIGYNQSDNSGPIINRELSIDFLKMRKQEKVNTNENAESGGEIFKENWENIKVNRLIKLSEIEDFDKLDMGQY